MGDMRLDYIAGLTLSGDPTKPNDDAFAHSERLAAVFDGATSLGDPILPVDSDAAWIARKGAEGLIAHQALGARAALRAAAADAERDFLAQRLRSPAENYETPFASMMLIEPMARGLNCFWFGDCAALVLRQGEAVEIVGESFAKRAGEAKSAARLSEAKGLAPASGANRPEYLPELRAARNRVNSPMASWLFAPDQRCAEHVASKTIRAQPGATILLASDGFFSLATDYGAYDPQQLVETALARSLKLLFEELRAIETSDPEGRRFPRFKKSDDATALLVRIIA